MNKKVLIGILAVLVLVLLGGGYWFTNRKSGEEKIESKAESASETVKEVPTTAPAKSLRALLSAGVPQKCTFTTDSASASGTGTFMISSGKVRGEISSQIEGKTTLAHIIVDGNTSYMWFGDATTGFKMSIDPQTITPAPDGSNNSGFDPDKPTNFTCVPWVADATQFVLPTNIKFSELPKAGSVPSVKAADKCAVCSYLTGEDKTTCLTNLGCSK